MMRCILIVLFASLILPLFSQALPIDTTADWHLQWSDDFDYPDSELETNWTSQNKASGGVVLCSRWRENAVVHDGILELKAIKEERGGQDWTCGNVWTKDQFHYGYYECRYKYAGASGTNNSFWMWPQTVPEGEKKFELDVNEGHYPNIVNTNIHNWSDVADDGTHPQSSKRFVIGGVATEPGYTHVFSTPIKTSKIRFLSSHESHFHIGEFRVYAPNSKGYPSDVTSETADSDVDGLENHTRGRGVSITASGQYTVSGRNTDATNVADGSVKSSTWIAQAEGDKWLLVDFGAEKEVGCVQFTNGWLSGTEWKGLIYNYTLQYWDGAEWLTFSTFDASGDEDFSQEYHTYGMLWDDRSISYYFDGELLRRESHSECISPTRIYLSLAILDMNIAGAVTDAIDGTSMKVDYVRYYTPNATSSVNDASIEPIAVLPNPSRTSISFSGLSRSAKVKIYDVQGALCTEAWVERDSELDISDLRAGLYIYHIFEDQHHYSGKLIKQ